MSKIVIFSPSQYSLYTICVTELLRRKGIEIKAIVVLRLLNFTRFRKEFKRDGERLLKKIWKKAVLREKAYSPADYETMLDLLGNERITVRNVKEFKKKFSIPVVFCNDLNAPVVLDVLNETKPDLVVFTGGGLIRKPVLQSSGHGILNCHMGVLPRYRGMDVIEWAILEEQFDQIGLTVHFMDQGVDTGDILRIVKIPLRSSEETIARLRERFEPIMCRTMVETAVDFLNGTIRRRPQKAEDGKQYFIMHPLLKRIAEQKIRTKFRPSGNATVAND
jgi:hypothetical protein